MVARLALLILFTLTPLLTAEPLQAAAAPRCLTCHPPHYREQGSCRHCHRGNEATSRRELAHNGLIGRAYAGFSDPRNRFVLAGQRLAQQAACRRCHRLEGRGNRLAADLDLLALTASPAQLAAAIDKPALYMPDFRFTRSDRDLLITALLAGAHRTPSVAAEPPRSVHFSQSERQRSHPFALRCGGCHRALSAGSGPWGNGTSAPDLSGLFSPHYPASYPGRLPWTAERLQRWLTNPLKLRAFTLMRPIPLQDDELRKIVELLADSGSRQEPAAAGEVGTYNSQLKR